MQVFVAEKQRSRQEETPFSALIAESFGRQTDHEAGWSISMREGWIIVSHRDVQLPDQGWKLHVSAGLGTAEAVLRRTLPVLRAEKVCFKVAATLKKLRALNHGFEGGSQIGKFITVYPTTEAQAVLLAVALDKATHGLRGPVVPSDTPLHAHSLVSYRYGSYINKLMYTPAGKVVSAITSPSGKLVPDSRKRTLTVLEGIQDPFLAAGVTRQAEKAENLVIGGRYLQLSSLYQSPRGGISLGVDILQARTCVIKFARANAYLDMSGKDARDSLRYEARMLERFAGDPSFPALFDLVEQDSTLYMVMEEIQGETLGKYVERLFATGDFPVRQIISWARALATILGNIHARGLVYRDLKPTNIMVVSEQELRLIDFELVIEQGRKHARSDIGTRGFMSPQHQAGQAACIADDIYSLGALLYYLVTRANPSLAPDHSHLLQRPLTILNPALDQRLAEIITRCLEPDAEQRFPSMDALDAALAALEETRIAIPHWNEENVLPASQEGASHHYLALVRRLGETLCQAAIRQLGQPGITWLSTVQFAGGRPLRAVNTGCSGTLLALAELVETFNDPSHRSKLEEGTEWLLHSDALIANPVPGLYVGEAGVGAALLRAGQILGDERLVAAAAQKSHWVARQPYTCQDLMSGAAGRLRFHLLVWDETRDSEHLQSALAAGNWLVSVAEDAGEGAVCWTLPPEFTGMTYAGYAHGAAGIADALLDLFEVTQDERYLTPVAGTYRLLERLAVPVLGDRSGLNWPLYVFDKTREMAGIYWCHGATGIGKFLLHVSELKLLSQAEDLARRAARTVARGSRWTNPTQCHGLAGNIEFLLDMFQRTGEQIYHVEALILAGLLETFAIEQDGHLVWSADEPSCISPDYLVGYAGVLVCLLRLANHEHRPHLLSRQGFRYRPALAQAEGENL